MTPTESKSIARIRKIVEYIRTDMLNDVIKELEDDEFEGDVHLEAIMTLSSACLTFAQHIKMSVEDMGGSTHEFNIGDGEKQGEDN